MAGYHPLWERDSGFQLVFCNKAVDRDVKRRSASSPDWLGRLGAALSVRHFPVCYRYFDCFDSFSGWYGMVVLQVVFDSLIFVRHLIV